MANRYDTPRTAKCCEAAREGLSAMIDGEADDAEVVALRKHLQECRDCEAHFEALSILHIRLREELIDSTDPNAVWQRISAELDAEDTRLRQQNATGARSGFARRWAPIAAAAVLILAIFMGSSGLWMSDINALPVVTETNRDYETFRVSGRPLDVSAANPGEVKQWMAAKLDFQLPSNMSGPAGFKLAGGRLCSFLNRRLAFFQYESGNAGFSLYVMKKAGLRLPNMSDFATVQAPQGFTTVIWQHEGLVYLAVSELPEEEVQSLVAGMIEHFSDPKDTHSNRHELQDDRRSPSRA